MSETFVCELCHQEHPLSDRRGFDGRDLCASCWNSRTVLCLSLIHIFQAASDGVPPSTTRNTIPTST